MDGTPLRMQTTVEHHPSLESGASKDVLAPIHNTDKHRPRFSPLKHLGNCPYGFVHLVHDSHMDASCAVKYIARGLVQRNHANVLREISSHWRLGSSRHPHVVQFHEIFPTPQYLGLAMEHVAGTNLQTYLHEHGGQLKEGIARFIFQQIMIDGHPHSAMMPAVLEFCQKKGDMNRDIRPENFLLETHSNPELPLVKLFDFGFSKYHFCESSPAIQLKTALFTAPEVFTSSDSDPLDPEAVNVFSCGVILYVMLFGRHPFLEACNPCSAQQQLPEGDPRVAMKLMVSNMMKSAMAIPADIELSMSHAAALDLLQRMLTPEPHRRIKISKVLEHPWFKKGLPQGACLINDAYLAPADSSTRQTLEHVKQIVATVAGIDTCGSRAAAYAASATPFANLTLAGLQQQQAIVNSPDQGRVASAFKHGLLLPLDLGQHAAQPPLQQHHSAQQLMMHSGDYSRVMSGVGATNSGGSGGSGGAQNVRKRRSEPGICSMGSGMTSREVASALARTAPDIVLPEMGSVERCASSAVTLLDIPADAQQHAWHCTSDSFTTPRYHQSPASGFGPGGMLSPASDRMPASNRQQSAHTAVTPLLDRLRCATRQRPPPDLPLPAPMESCSQTPPTKASPMARLSIPLGSTSGQAKMGRKGLLGALGPGSWVVGRSVSSNGEQQPLRDQPQVQYGAATVEHHTLDPASSPETSSSLSPGQQPAACHDGLGLSAAASTMNSSVAAASPETVISMPQPASATATRRSYPGGTHTRPRGSSAAASPGGGWLAAAAAASSDALLGLSFPALTADCQQQGMGAQGHSDLSQQTRQPVLPNPRLDAVSDLQWSDAPMKRLALASSKSGPASDFQWRDASNFGAMERPACMGRKTDWSALEDALPLPLPWDSFEAIMQQDGVATPAYQAGAGAACFEDVGPDGPSIDHMVGLGEEVLGAHFLDDAADLFTY